MSREKQDQSIVFSGESGAGKTENAKYTILYLLTISAKENQVREKILASSTILQAFGNAKTIKNDNSSRFGEFLEIQYDPNYHINGASLRIYLLDRSRIVFQVPSIFLVCLTYQIINTIFTMSGLNFFICSQSAILLHEFLLYF